jgi:hypothetical protein
LRATFKINRNAFMFFITFFKHLTSNHIKQRFYNDFSHFIFHILLMISVSQEGWRRGVAKGDHGNKFDNFELAPLARGMV